ncbi:hypothetical protein BXZ70DRAFT_914436 [Cristinia sonorae]|uniref:SET domain-containing protein n=1 Tax=Cristinia sonorae TaxID=1940300 RepID=A0A8K0V0G3_9AGAR|nr:hypothetical protein BXZ70DRAFT_914436 [Cristinia sonorae]
MNKRPIYRVFNFHLVSKFLMVQHVVSPWGHDMAQRGYPDCLRPTKPSPTFLSLRPTSATMAGFRPDMAELAGMMANMGIQFPLSAGTTLGQGTRNAQIDDDSEFGRHQQAFERAKAVHIREQSLPPAKARELPRMALLAQFQSARDQEHLQRAQGMNFTSRQTYVGTVPRFSSTKLEDLERISISQLMVRKCHKGRFLLCRIICQPTHLVSIDMAVEDPEGGTTRLAVYHYPFALDCSTDEAAALFSVGTVLAVREPYYKYAASGEIPMLRVDAASDIMFLDSKHPLVGSVSWSTGRVFPAQTPSTPNGWKEKGVGHFKRKEWLCAAIAFSEGLRLEATHHLLLLNRSETYLRLGWFRSAASDAEAVMAMDLKDTTLKRKALVRATKAYYSSRRYQEVQQLAEMYPDDADVQEFSTKSRERIHENDTGNYDWQALYRESRQPASRPDIAPYTGPVEVRSPENGVRGVFVTRDVKAGELLVVSKPIASCFPEDNPKRGMELFLAHNFLTSTIDTRADYTLIETVVQRMWEDPNLANTIGSMYAGKSMPPTTAYPPMSTNQPPLSHPRVPSSNIDIARVEAVCSLNAFGLGDDTHKDYAAFNKFEKSCALYEFPSFCNHSCVASGTRSFFGDVMTIRASKDLKAGEELTLVYHIPTEPYQDRQDHVQRKWGFACGCLLCNADRADKPASRDFRARIQKMPEVKTISEAQKRVSDIRSSYSDTPERRLCHFKPHLHLAYQALATSYVRAANAKGAPDVALIRKSAEAFMDALEAAGVIITDRSLQGSARARRSKAPYGGLPVDTTQPPSYVHLCVLAAIQVAHSLMALNQQTRAVNWAKTAVWLEDLATGGGVSLFKEKYHEMCAGIPI